MRSLSVKLLLAFLAVALVAVGLLGVLVGRAASGAFEQYLISRETGDLGEMGRMMDEMMGPEASQAMFERMIGPAERAYLAAINDALWVAGALAALAAVGVGLLLARQISGPIRALTWAARRMAGGDLDQRVPVRSRDELGELAPASAARFASRAEERGVVLEVQAAQGLPRADVDPDRISQVLGNLLENALRHTPPGGGWRCASGRARGRPPCRQRSGTPVRASRPSTCRTSSSTSTAPIARGRARTAEAASGSQWSSSSSRRTAARSGWRARRDGGRRSASCSPLPAPVRNPKGSPQNTKRDRNLAARSGPGWPGVGADDFGPVHFSCPSLYNLVALTLMRRTHLLVLAVLVAAFVAFYPSLGVADHSCDTGECPQVAHVGTMASVCFTAVCAAVVLSAPYAASVLGVFSKRRILSEPRPNEAYLPPDPQPPRLSLSR